MSDKKQLPSANEQDVSLIQSIFAKNEQLLKLIRTTLFGLPLSKTDKETVRGVFANKELVRIFKRRFMPSFDDADVPIGQTLDLWAGVDIRGLTKDAIFQSVHARQKLIDMTVQGIERLINPEAEPVDLSYNPRINFSDDLHIVLIARNSYLSNVENQLGMIKLIADQKAETIDETKKRLAKDSSK